MANTYTLLASNVLTSSSSMITFNNFNGGYQDLVIRISAKTDDSGTSDYVGMRINNLSTSIYNSIYLSGNGSATSSSTDSNISMNYPGFISASTNTANTFGSMEIYIPSYAISEQKVSNTYGANEGNAVARGMALTANRVATTDPITEIDLFPFFGTNFVAGSSFYLYGVFNGTGNVSTSTPTIGTATAGNTTASITFTPTSATGVDASYTALSTPGSITATGTSSPITVSGLTNNTAYTFQVRANNPNGSSAYSAASNSVTPIDPAAFESIATSLPDAGATSLTFSSIPTTYKHLQMRIVARRNADGALAASLRFNGDSGNNYMSHTSLASGTSTSYDNFSSQPQMQGIYVQVGTRAANNYGPAIYDFIDYMNTNKLKTVVYWGGVAIYNSSSEGRIEFGGGTWNNTAAINEITVTFRGDALAANCRFELYGIKG